MIRLLCACVLVVSGCNAPVETEKPGEKKDPSPIRLSLNQLRAEYDADDLATVRRYEGKYLELTGMVGKDDEKPLVLSLADSERPAHTNFAHAQCSFDKRFKDNIARARTGETAVVRGWFAERVKMGAHYQIRLERCDYLRVLKE